MHCAKYNKQGLGNLLSHYERKNNKYRKYANENIDKEKTINNYNLAPEHEEGLYKFIKNRVEELNIIKRKTAIWACDWCITVPQEIKDDEEKYKEFFQKTYEFLKNRYDEKNVVCSYVHLDETTPHMHFCFIPVIHKQECEFDSGTGNLITKTVEKVLAKEVITKAELSSIHTDLQRFLENELDFEAKILTGTTNKKYKNVNELKYKTELEKQIKENQQTLDEMKKAMKQLSTNYLNLYQNATHYNRVLIEEEKERKKELESSANYVQNLMNGYDIALDDLLREIENRDNKIYNIDLSYKKSLEVLKELENTNKQAKEIKSKIEEKTKEYNKIKDDELDLV